MEKLTGLEKAIAEGREDEYRAKLKEEYEAVFGIDPADIEEPEEQEVLLAETYDQAILMINSSDPSSDKIIELKDRILNTVNNWIKEYEVSRKG